MSLSRSFQDMQLDNRGTRSQSAQGLTTALSNSAMKIPLPPRLWITDASEDSSDDMECSVRDDSILTSERSRVRSRYRHNKQRSTGNVPIGIFWDIENCQVPRGCSAIDVVTAIRAKFLLGRREADFVVVCDVRKEAAIRLQELNDAQISLIHVCGTQKNAADEKLRQCMRRFGELHTAPAALLLISGDINFAADLSDFRYRKNMDVILVHKQNTSSALIACATSHHCYNELTANLPRNSKVPTNYTEEQDSAEATCKLEIVNLPAEHAPERVSRRLRRLADNCGGKVLSVTASTAILKFPTPDHAFRALKRMDGEDVFGCKIGTRLVRACAPSYSSDEGYGTATANVVPARPSGTPQLERGCSPAARVSSWALAQQLPPPPPPPPVSMPRKIRGTHGSANLDQSGSSSANSTDSRFPRDASLSRAASPWNCSQLSEASAASDADDAAELTVANLPLMEPNVLQEMLTSLFAQYVPVTRVCVWAAGEGPLASVTLRCEADARLGIARLHKRRLDQQWGGRRLELSLGRPSPAPNLDVLRARLRAILLDAKGHTLPLLRLRDAYASRHCCALTTSDLTKVKDTVLIHEGFGRMVQLVDLAPVSHAEMEEAPWKCHAHAAITGHDDGGRILAPVCMEVAVLAQHTHVLLENHGGMLPLLSFVECYEATFPPLIPDPVRGVALELLLRSVPGVVVRDMPARHVTWRAERRDTPSPLSHYSDSSSVGGGGCGGGGGRARSLRTAPALEPMLTLFERELVDLLRATPKCCIPFSKLIPAFHHHFGRQCRVADYGFTKLPDLLAALGNTIVVLGSGSSRVITISAAAQARRWTTDLVKLLRAQPGRAIYPHDIPQLYQQAYGKAFSPVDYGVCTLHELMQRVSPQAIVYGTDSSISLPRRTPTLEEKARTVQFAVQAIELLCYTPNLRMEFSRFVPAYHAHFGRQLRVAHYGCVKLVELFELIPEAVRVRAGSAGEREVGLAVRPARAVVGQRLKAITPTTLPALAAAYVAQFGAVPLPDMLDAASLEELVVAAGGAIEDGIVRAPGDAPRSVSAALMAAAALSSDRSVRGSGDEYFSAAYRELAGRAPDARALVAAGVITHRERRVVLRPEWRAVFRIAQILAFRSPLSAAEIYVEYTKRYEPVFPTSELGFESTLEFLRHYREVFSEDGAQRFCVCAGVAVPRCQTRAPPGDLSIHDTPPGQKGSRVFESPKTSIWCSPPASALPAPSALLAHDVKRRTRLAAQFNIA